MKVKSFWHIETAKEIIEEPDFKDSNYTPVRPPDENIDYEVPCSFVKGVWVLDEKSKEFLNLYQKLRGYPDIKEQLDMLYWDKVNGTKKWQESIAAVKLEYPKPEKTQEI